MSLKLHLVLRAALAAGVLVISCGKAAPPPPPEAGTRPFVDDLGRRLELPPRPRRIISTSPEITEILFAVGAGDRLVGVVRGCDWPPEARELPVVGDFSNVSLERVAALDADLILTTGHEQERMMAQLEGLGIPMVAFMAADVASVRRNVAAVGEIVGEEEAAAGVIAAFDAELTSVEAEVKRIPEAERPRVYLEISPEPLMTVAERSFVHEAIVRAGGVNIGEDLPRPYCRLEPELVIAWDPEVIVLAHGAVAPAAVASRTGWEGIAAVRTGRVYEINPDLILRAGPRLGRGIATLHELFYREP
jgi:iron complex transport system substrate-binding protein